MIEEKLQVKDLKAGDNVEVIELVVKSVGQGKLGKPPGNVPYQHNWLTDGTGDIRFSLFGDDVNKLQEGQTIKVINGYIKEYPAGSGKLQLALGKDGGNWQIVSSSGQPIDKDDIVVGPVQIVNGDAKEEYVTKRACLHVIGQIFQGTGQWPIEFLGFAQEMYDWVMPEELSPRETPKKPRFDGTLPSEAVQESLAKAGLVVPSKDDPDQEKGPGAVKIHLNKNAFKIGSTAPSEKQLELYRLLLDKILDGDSLKRRTWQKWTFNKESSTDMTKGEVQATLNMLKLEKNEETGYHEPTSDKAIEAIKAMFKQALIDAGQTEMNFEKSVEELYGP